MFDKRKPEVEETAAAAAEGAFSSFSRHSSPLVKSSSPNTESAAESSEPTNQARERRGRQWSIRSKAGRGGSGGDDLTHGTIEMGTNPWDDDKGEEKEDEAAAGFGNFGGTLNASSGGGNGDGTGEYYGAGLDRLMRVMAASRKLNLVRLEVRLLL